jgi:predicted nucleic acid-binding protein
VALLPRNLFVDTGAFVAIEYPYDEHHAAAKRFQAKLKHDPTRLYTSNFVLAETYTWLRRKLGHAAAVRFGQWIKTSQIVEIVRVPAEVEDMAWGIFCRYDDKEFSYTDCTSFAMMQLLGLDTAFAFDQHFRQFGFVCLPRVE